MVNKFVDFAIAGESINAKRSTPRSNKKAQSGKPNSAHGSTKKNPQANSGRRSQPKAHANKSAKPSNSAKPTSQNHPKSQKPENQQKPKRRR
jgi:hypothetical protein